MVLLEVRDGIRKRSMDKAIDCAKKGDLEFFKEAPVDILLEARDSNDGDDTVLSIVVRDNRLDCCIVICEICPSLLRHRNRQEGSTPLHLVAYRGYLGILEILISTCEKADLEYQHDIEGKGGDRADQQKTLTLRTTQYGDNAMHKAVHGGQPESIKLLIKADTNKELLRAGDLKNNTPLHIAVGLKNNKTAELLMEADPDFPYSANSDGKTPLLMAIDNAINWRQDYEMLKLILELQPTQSKVKYNENGWTALHYCVSRKFVDTIGDIIKSCIESSKVADNEGQNFFQHAVTSGNVKMVKHILGMEEIAAEVLNSKDNLGRTPLEVAAESRNESMIVCLLEDPRVDLKSVDVDENGDPIFFKAAKENHLFLCKELCKRSPSLIYYQSKGGHTALHHAAESGEPEMLKFLIEAGTKSYAEDDNESGGTKSYNDEYVEDDIESGGTKSYAEGDFESGGGEIIPQKKLLTMLDDQGDTALHKAVLNHKLKAMKLLLEADPSYKYNENNSGDTPIMIAIREARSNENKFDSGEIRRLLFKMQPRQTMEHRGEKGWTSLLHQATSEEDLSIIEDIIEFSTGYLDVVPVDNNGKNFLHIATELGKIEVVRLVFRAKDTIKLKSCLEQIDNEGKNFLHIAAELGKVEVMRLVLRAKDIIKLTSCLGQLDNEGKNFLHIAAEFEKVEIVKQVLRVKDIPEDGVLNKKDKEGNTPFHIAALTGNEPLTRRFLFDRRVNKDTKNNDKQHVLSEIKFPYDKRKAGVYDIAHTVDQSDLKDQSDFDLVVGALIATVSFTAGITIPGGYISDGPSQGTAVFSKKVSFATFIISNTFALIFSLYAVFSHFCARRMHVEADIIHQLKVATYCTLAAIYCMMAAFVAGSFAVLANSNWLAIVVSIISCFFFIPAFRPMWKIAKQHKLAACVYAWVFSKAC